MEKWLNCPVTGLMPWPKTETHITYNEYEMTLLPLNETYDPSLHLNMIGLSNEEAMTVVNRFTSLLCWKQSKLIEQITEGDIMAVIHPFPKKEGFRYISYMEPYPKLINGPKGDKEQLALSLYREGLTVNSVPYRFLSFFKILNLKYRDRYIDGKNELREWIANNIKNVKSPKAISRIAELDAQKIDVTDYLYSSCRCAVAHAYSAPVVDPDSILDIRRLQSDIKVVDDLATYEIETEMNISKSMW